MIKQDMKNPPHPTLQASAQAQAVPLGGWAAMGLAISTGWDMRYEIKRPVSK